MSTEHALIKRAVDRTRSHAARQFLLGTAFAAGCVVWAGSPTLTYIFVAVYALITFVMGRRWWRLRRRGSAVKALLQDPTQVASVYSWPRKLPPNTMPMMLDVFTHDGSECSLLLESKKPEETIALVNSIKERSPDAIIAVPTVPQAIARN